MKNLKDIITEKLRINQTMKVDLDSLLDIDDDGYTNIGHKRAKNENGYMFWALAWQYLHENGPMRKLDLMKEMNAAGLTNAKPGSNVSTFATLNRQGIICGVKGKLEARPPEEWKI